MCMCTTGERRRGFRFQVRLICMYVRTGDIGYTCGYYAASTMVKYAGMQCACESVGPSVRPSVRPSTYTCCLSARPAAWSNTCCVPGDGRGQGGIWYAAVCGRQHRVCGICMVVVSKVSQARRGRMPLHSARKQEAQNRRDAGGVDVRSCWETHWVQRGYAACE